jgi:hypothetical protein
VTFPAPLGQPEGEKLRDRRTERLGETGMSVGPSDSDGRKARERGTYERVARGGVRPVAGAGGYITRIELRTNQVIG